MVQYPAAAAALVRCAAVNKEPRAQEHQAVQHAADGAEQENLMLCEADVAQVEAGEVCLEAAAEVLWFQTRMQHRSR